MVCLRSLVVYACTKGSDVDVGYNEGIRRFCRKASLDNYVLGYVMLFYTIKNTCLPRASVS